MNNFDAAMQNFIEHMVVSNFSVIIKNFKMYNEGDKVVYTVLITTILLFVINEYEVVESVPPNGKAIVFPSLSGKDGGVKASTVAVSELG